MLATTVDQLSSEMAGRIKVAKINIDENPGTANRFEVRSIPTLLVLKSGKVVDRLVGVQPKQEIVRRLEKVLAG
jgi:thioredoxin-like negative regulator of GroEL